MKLILAAALAVSFTVTARADEPAAAPKAAAPAKSSWSEFFKNLKNTLSQSAVGGERKKGRGATGVAAVRGSEQGKRNIADPNEPAIKGDAKSTKAKKEQAYDLELEASVDLIGKGKLDEALKGLEAFKVSHPKYRADDVDKAIEGVKAMIADKTGIAPAAAPAAK